MSLIGIAVPPPSSLRVRRHRRFNSKIPQEQRNNASPRFASPSLARPHIPIRERPAILFRDVHRRVLVVVASPEGIKCAGEESRRWTEEKEDEEEEEDESVEITPKL